METKNLDVVYFVKDGIRNEELRYSLRSVCDNMLFNKVWIFGGCPLRIVPDVRIRVEQTGDTKWDRVRNMFIMACENKELTDNFILFNDDFFVMKPTKKLEPLYRDTLENHIKVLPKGRYRGLLKDAERNLVGRGATTLSYELHTPFIFNKQKLLKMMRDDPNQHCTRTIYGNLYDVGGKKHSDVKIFSSQPKFDYKNSELLSTDDTIINVNNDAWRWLKKQFPNRCKYELE